MLEGDRNRDGMLDPHEIEKRAGQVPYTGPQSLRHSDRRNWDDWPKIFRGDPAPTDRGVPIASVDVRLLE
jgi:hypothetical protein